MELKMSRVTVKLVDAIIKNIAPDLPFRTYLEGKKEPVLCQWVKFEDPISVSQMPQHYLMNLEMPKQIPAETAEEIVTRMMSLRQKVFSVFNEDKCGYSTSLIQNRFLHTIFVGLCNDSMN